jgi:hypothetical protein
METAKKNVWTMEDKVMVKETVMKRTKEMNKNRRERGK